MLYYNCITNALLQAIEKASRILHSCIIYALLTHYSYITHALLMHYLYLLQLAVYKARARGEQAACILQYSRITYALLIFTTAGGVHGARGERAACGEDC
jgi:hypothetical protein